MVDGETSDPGFDDVVGNWKELDEQGREFAERQENGPQRQETAKWPETSEFRDRDEKLSTAVG